jgi:hypothetical protein
MNVKALMLAATLVMPISAHAEDLTDAFNRCLLSKGVADGSYTSAGGGKSAIRLIVACHAQFKPWHNQCMADGESDGQCTLMAGMLAQASLKLMGQ